MCSTRKKQESFYKKAILTVVLGGLAIFFLFASATLLVSILESTLNIYPFALRSNNSQRELIFTCKLDNELTIRAYYFHGSHATTSDSNSVHVQFRSQPYERIVWYAYSSPFIKEISCEEDILRIKPNSEYHLDSFSISADEIRNDLVDNPIHLYKGQLENRKFPDLNELGCFFMLLFPGILCVFAIVRLLKSKQTSMQDEIPTVEK